MNKRIRRNNWILENLINRYDASGCKAYKKEYKKRVKNMRNSLLN